MHIFSKPFIKEIICLAIAALVTLFVCLTFAKTDSVPLDTPYQATFSHIYPAIFFACGHGLVTTDVEKIPGLSEFIYRETDLFDTSVLPAVFPEKKLSAPAATTHLYYLYAIGWIWWLLGVSVDAVVKYTIVLRVLCAVIIFGILRLGLSRIAALTTVLIIFTSPAMLNMDISPRDMGKAPFILGFLLLSAWMALRSHPPKTILLLSSALGLLLGIGFGFRQDILVCMPLAFFVSCFLARVNSSRAVTWRFAGTILMSAFFLALSWPIFKASALEGNQQTSVHTFLVGMSENVESNLLAQNQSYNLLPDSFSGEAISYAIVNTYARRMGNRESMINPCCAEYERFMGDKNAHLLMDPYFFYNGKAYAETGRLLMRDLFLYFPADFVIRAWCSVQKLFNTNRYYASVLAKSREPRPPWIRCLLSAQTLFADHIASFGLVYLVLALTVLAAFQFRKALIFTLFFLWFAGYPSLQFEYRHSFYLVFIPVMALAVCIEHLLRWLIAMHKHGVRCSCQHIPGKAIRACLFIILVLSAYAIPLWGLRIFQSYQLNHLADLFNKAPKESVPLISENREAEIFLSPDGPLPGLLKSDSLPPGETAWDYIALSFDTHGYDIPITIHYDENRLLNNFTQTITVRGFDDAQSGRVTLYCPIYEVDTTYSMDMLKEFLRTFPTIAAEVDDSRPLAEQQWWRRSKFMGISFPSEYLGLFVGFHRVDDIESAHLLPIMQVPEDRRCMQTYKTAPWEDRLKAFCKTYFPKTPTVQGPSIRNECWNLDEKLIYHPSSKVFSRLLLSTRSVDTYISEWRARVTSLPMLKRTAAMDLANAATFWLNQNNCTEALDACNAACEFDPDDPLYHVRTGQLQELCGDSGEALKHYIQALFLQPLLPDTAARTDILFKVQGNRVGQRNFWREVFERYPDSWFAGMRSGALYEEDGMFSEAAAAYDKVYTNQPDHPDTRLALARCLGRSGNPIRALKLLQELSREHPDYLKLVILHTESLGEYFSAQNDYPSARTAYLNLTSLEPENPMWWLRLGDAQMKCSQSREGEDSYRKAMALAQNSNSPVQTEIQERLTAITSPGGLP